MTQRELVAEVAERHGIALDALDAAVSEVFAHRAQERAERRERREANPAPTSGRFAAITSGQYAPKNRPRGGPRGAARSKPEDKLLVPAALKHWRLINGGLTTRQAQARIGYSTTSCSWRHWESGVYAPPYRTLVLIVAATGVGHWVDHGLPAHGSPVADLEAAGAEHQALRRRRRPANP